VLGGGSVFFFVYEGEKGPIEGLENLLGYSRVLDDFPNIFVDDASTVVKEIGSEPTWSRSLAQ